MKCEFTLLNFISYFCCRFIFSAFFRRFFASLHSHRLVLEGCEFIIGIKGLRFLIVGSFCGVSLVLCLSRYVVGQLERAGEGKILRWV